MQIAGGNGAFPVNATAGHGVAINDGVLLELGLASQTGELMLGHCLLSLRVQQEVAERDRLFANESASATGNLGCSWE